MDGKGPQDPWKQWPKRPRPPDEGSSEGVEFKDWDWKKHDPEFYEQFHRMPESKDPQNIDQVKWNRYMHAKASGLPKRDYSPRNFLFVMRKEVAIFSFSIFMGLMLPFIYNARQQRKQMVPTNNMQPPAQRGNP